MHNKPDDLERQPKGAKHDTDTSSIEQLHGTQDSRSTPNRPYEKMPHERDESARPADDRSNESAPASQRQISQAQKDVAAGLVDTDRRGVPDDVPGGKR
jgi:hypothetical protein